MSRLSSGGTHAQGSPGRHDPLHPRGGVHGCQCHQAKVEATELGAEFCCTQLGEGTRRPGLVRTEVSRTCIPSTMNTVPPGTRASRSYRLPNVDAVVVPIGRRGSSPACRGPSIAQPERPGIGSSRRWACQSAARCRGQLETIECRPSSTDTREACGASPFQSSRFSRIVAFPSSSLER